MLIHPLWRNVAVMSLTLTLTLTGVCCWLRVLANHLRALGAGEGEVGLVFMAMAFAWRLPQIVGGVLSDRVGRKVVIVAATLLMAACYVAAGFSGSWIGIGAALSAAWIVGGMQWPAILSLVSESVPAHRRGLAIGIIEWATTVGIAFGPFVGGRVERAIGNSQAAWPVLLLISTGLYLAAAALRVAFLRDPARAKAEPGARVPIAWRRVLLPAFMVVLANGMFFLTTDGPIISLYLEDELARTHAQIDDLFFYGGLAALAGAPLAGWATDRLGARRVMGWSLALLTLLMAPFVVAQAWGDPLHRIRGGLDEWIFVTLFVPGEFFIVAYEQYISSQGDPSRRAATIGAFGLIIGAFSPWALLLGGWMYDAYGRTVPLAAAGVSCALAAILWSFLPKEADAVSATTLSARPTTS